MFPEEAVEDDEEVAEVGDISVALDCEVRLLLLVLLLVLLLMLLALAVGKADAVGAAVVVGVAEGKFAKISKACAPGGVIDEGETFLPSDDDVALEIEDPADRDGPAAPARCAVAGKV